MKITFCLSARLGDICCGIPSFYALREKYPNADLRWLTLPQYVPLVPSCGTPLPHGSPPFGSYPNWQPKPPDLLIKAQPMWRHAEWEGKNVHLIDLIAKWSNVTLKERRIKFNIDQKVKQEVDSLNLPKDPIAICSSPCYSCFDWPSRQRQWLIDALVKSGNKIITVGGKDGLDYKGAQSYHGKLSLLGTVEAINRCSLYIGPDTGCTWLACGSRNTPKLCITDRHRFKIGLVGFQKFLSDDNIIDINHQEGVEKMANAALKLLEKWRRT